MPFGKKANDEESEEETFDESSTHQDDKTDQTDISELGDESEEENSSLVNKLKSKLSGLKKKNKNTSDDDEDDSDDEDVTDDEAAKKKKKSKILQYVIGGGLVVFLLSDYIFPPDEAPAPDPSTLLKPRAKKTPVTPADEVAPAPTPNEEPAPVVVDEPAPAPSEEPAPVVVDEPAPAPSEEPAPVVVDEPAPTPSEEPDTEPAITNTDTPDDSPVEVTSDDFSSGEVVDYSDTSLDTINGDESAPSGEDNLTDRILLDLEKQAKSSKVAEQKKEYVAPPDYEYKGRGLVYNCTGKHWACVDAPSYKACEDNSSSVKYLKKNTECYPFNIYETTRGCESVQNRMVSSSAQTSFCND